MYTIIFLSTATTHMRRSLYTRAIISVLDPDNRGPDNRGSTVHNTMFHTVVNEAPVRKQIWLNLHVCYYTVTMAKGIGNGFPLAAVVTTEGESCACRSMKVQELV